jgi:aspartate carbamoyltransferase catalytic subunit
VHNNGKSAPNAVEGCSARAETLSCSRSLLSISDLTLEEIDALLGMASVLEVEDPLVRARRLAKRRVALLFYESSTRTRTSFELAAKSLGADTALISSQSSSIEKGESLRDTGITLKALGAECIILRHLCSGSPYLLAHATGLPVLNAGDGMHEHPSQALLDLRTILEAMGRSDSPIGEKTLEGVTVSITGDIFHSRVARSNALLLPRLGARVILCGPPALLPDVAADLAPGIEIERDFDRALEASQVVMMLRIQKERLAGVQIDLDQYVERYQLHEARLRARAPQAVVMHPGPMIRGLEITSEVADGPRSLIAEQVRNGVSIRMALVHRALVSVSSLIPESADPVVERKAAARPPSPAIAAVSSARKKSLAKAPPQVPGNASKTAKKRGKP